VDDHSRKLQLNIIEVDDTNATISNSRLKVRKSTLDACFEKREGKSSFGCGRRALEVGGGLAGHSRNLGSETWT